VWLFGAVLLAVGALLFAATRLGRGRRAGHDDGAAAGTGDDGAAAGTGDDAAR